MRQVISAIFLLLALTLQAQDNDFKPELYIGAGAGVVYTTVDFQPKVLEESVMGYKAGISAKYITEKHLGMALELNYTQRGWAETDETDPSLTFSRTLNYLEMPIMTHIYFGRKIRYIINLGPQVSYLLGSSSDMSSTLSDLVAQQPQEGPNPFVRFLDADNKFDYGLVGGMGMSFNSGIGTFDLEGRYYYGLADVFSNRREDFYSRSASRIFEAKLTYFIKIQ